MNRPGIVAVLVAVPTACLLGAQAGPQPELIVQKIRQTVVAREIAYKLTTPDEFKQLIGPPDKEERQQDGDADVLSLRYSDTTATFVRIRQEFGADRTFPFTLYMLTTQDQPIDIGQDRPITLKGPGDLSKFDSFWGYAGASLAALDLRTCGDLLEKMPFDSRTVWPDPDKLPEGFAPHRRLEEGKNPGLGIYRLHQKGIDGRGIGIAIIDQPLLRDHEEYTDQVKRYEAIEVDGVPIQMHGAPVCSIAAGRKCGVAPRASVYYYAVPPWKWRDDKPWAELLDKIVAFNATLTDQAKIRVVSISLGAFSQRPNFALWNAAVDNAAQNGILVVTCDPTFLRLATLRRDPTKDPNDPASYTTGRYVHPTAPLGVPAGNRTTASHYGSSVYTYYIEGGMSWAVPYLAGLAALAFQVDPEIPPAEITQLWTATATKAAGGSIVNPPVFIEAVRSRRATQNP